MLSFITSETNLSKGRWLETVTFYNDKGRPVQVQSDNIGGGTDVSSSLYDFAGKVVSTYQVHDNPLSSLGIAVQVKTSMQYDDLGRLLSITKQLNDNPAFTKTIVQNEYDALGHLKKKTVGNGLESLNYDYNLRGWVLGVNRNYVKDAATNYFGFDLGYDKSGVMGTYSPQLNGNISGMVWKSKGDGEKRKYDFT
jgi:hypothetical protein